MHFKKFGKYTIIKKIASGGMADILLANDLNPTGSGRFVVIKRTLSKFSDNEEFKDMFKNEGKVACNLKHRNITPIYEFGIENDQFFLAMEYISGRNVREFVKKIQLYKSSISIPNTVHIIKEVAAGLNYAHNAIDTTTGKPLNLIHRDVSPQNIMLSFDGEIKLVDFGISKIADTNLTRAGHLKGKFSYMSPEQAYGEVLDERTDIFCLGIILWELLTNKRLFASKNEMASLKKVKNCDIPDAQKINPEIPTELNKIIKKSLSKNRNSRYKSGAILEQDLSVFLNKNYPEYSHYNLIALMKKVYRKEIMEEREKLKTYSSEFRKYLNTLNIEESLSSKNITLNIPELGSEKSKQTQLTTEFASHNLSVNQNQNTLTQQDNSISEHLSHFSNQINPPLKTKTNKGHSSTTLIQEKNTKQKEESTVKEKYETEQKVHPSKELTDATAPNLTLRTAPGLIKNQTDFLRSTQTFQSLNYTKSNSSLYDKKQHLYDDYYSSQLKRKKKVWPYFLFFIFLIGTFSTGTYLVIKKEYDLVSIVKNFNMKTSNQKPVQTQNPTTNTLKNISTQNNNSTTTKRMPSSKPKIQTKKVFITSTPSGAAIFINERFSSKYTPSLIDLTSNNPNITLKKTGYFSKNFIFDSQKNKQSLNIVLEANESKRNSRSKVQIIQ